jgi:hypothetical protein
MRFYSIYFWQKRKLQRNCFFCENSYQYVISWRNELPGGEERRRETWEIEFSIEADVDHMVSHKFRIKHVSVCKFRADHVFFLNENVFLIHEKFLKAIFNCQNAFWELICCQRLSAHDRCVIFRLFLFYSLFAYIKKQVVGSPQK